MRRVIGMDIHRTFAEVVFWEDGRLRHHGRVDMTRSGLKGSAAVCLRQTRSLSRQPAMPWRWYVCFRPSSAGNCRQPDAGEGDRPCQNQDRQDRRPRSGATKRCGIARG